jgi:hypothetical protein
MGIEDMSEPAKHLADALSIGVAIGALAKLLPSIAALLTILWLGIRIWESDTIRALTRRPLTGKRPDE